MQSWSGLQYSMKDIKNDKLVTISKWNLAQYSQVLNKVWAIPNKKKKKGKKSGILTIKTNSRVFYE